MTILADLYNRKLSESLTIMYIKILEKYSYKDLEEAFKKVIATAKFFPKPVEIIEALSGSKEDRTLSAWMVVHDSIRKHGHYASVDFGDPLIVKAINQMGGWNKLCSQTSDQLIWDQKEFERIYKNLIVSNFKGTETKVIGYYEQRNLLDGFKNDVPPVVQIENGKKKLIK